MRCLSSSNRFRSSASSVRGRNVGTEKENVIRNHLVPLHHPCPAATGQTYGLYAPPASEIDKSSPVRPPSSSCACAGARHRLPLPKNWRLKARVAGSGVGTVKDPLLHPWPQDDRFRPGLRFLFTTKVQPSASFWPLASSCARFRSCSSSNAETAMSTLAYTERGVMSGKAL